MEKAPEAFRTISEVADDLDVPKHVLRFWEGKFSQLRPLKRGGGRRYYRPEDIDLLRGIRQLLYGDGYTIKGVQRLLREQGVRFVMTCWKETAEGAPGAAVRNIPDVASDARSASGNAAGKKTEEQTASAEGLSKQQAERLRSVLAELEQCKKLLDAAKN